MNADEFKQLIIQNKTPYIKIYDLNNNLLFAHLEDPNAQVAVNMMEKWLPIFASYGRVKIHAANELQKKGNFTGCYKYDLHLTGPAATNTNTPVAAAAPQIGFMSQMTEFVQLMQLMQGMSAPKHQAELDAIRLEMKHQRELDALKNNDPMKMIAPIAPVLMTMMGMKKEDIASTLQMSAMSSEYLNANNNTAKISGPSLTTDSNVWTMDKAAALSNEEKTAEIQKILNALTDKISGEHFLVLLSIIDHKPELAAKAIQLHQNGMI